LASLDALPAAVRKQLPSGVFGKDVTFAGTTTFDPRTGFGADGTFTASRGGFREDALDGIRGRVRVGGTSVWTHVNAARYGAAKVSGEVAVDWKTKGISGAVRGDNIPVDKALERFPDLRGKIKGSPVGQFKGFAVLSGTTDRTDVAFRVIGSGSYAEADLPRVVKIDRAIAEGRYHDGAIALDRLRARTPAGTIGAQGSIDVRGKRLNLTVDGRGLDVGDFTTSLTGLASIVGDVDGTFDAPRFVGQLEGYDLGYQGTNLALLTAQLNATPKVIDATRLEVVVGSSQIGGHVALDLPSKRISGSFGSRALQIGDLLGDQYAGLVSLQSGELVGTYDDPRFTLTVTGKDLLAQELQVSSVEAFGDFRGRKLTLETLKAVAANGAVSATGDYDLDASAGHVSLTGSKLDLGAIMPSLQKTDKTALAGSVGGTANLAFAEKSITAVTATGTVAGLRANGTVLGDGVWNVSGDGHRLKGSAQASFGTRFLALENAALDLDAETLSSDVVASNLTLQNIYQFALPYLSNPGSDSNQQLALFDGDVKLIGHLDGKWSDPDLLVTSLQTDKLSYNGVGLGNLAASGSRVKGVWNVAGFDLVDGAARASARGVIDEAGETRLDGEIHNFDITKLAGAFPGLPPIGGVVSSSFLATGPTDHPQVRATLDAESVALEGHRVDFGANFDSITVGSAGIDAAGAVTYEGFHGQLVAHVPFAYPFSVPQGMPITAKLTLNQRPLSDLAPYAASIDPKRAQGAINGALALTGDRDSLHLSGGINIRAAEVGFRAVDPASKPGAPKYLPLATELKDLVFSLGVQDSALTADISAKSSQAGSIDGQISSKMAALDELLNGRTFADLDTWLSSPLSGKLAVNGLSVKESNKLATSSFALNGNLTVDGSLASPAIAGNVAVNNLNTTIPAVTSQPGTSTPPLIDPKFNIGFELQNPGHIGTGLASIDLMGRGRIGGSLSQLDASAALGVVRGELRLPGGRVTLDPGGVVRPSYQVDANGTSEARVQVELFGDSHVTAVRNGDIAERYDVHLDVHGDLLLPDQVVFTATSDPPDLTQDQILALLGRTDLLNALGSNTGYGQGERQFQTAALGYALPSLFDPITSRLAAGLGLDYLNVEYSALDQTSILAAKNLGHGFSFQVRRQVSLPTPGLPLTYDYRLVYQLPTRSRIIRRFSLFFGQDERTPWKLGLQYGTRL
ncbi:MAG TPA: translocation/assembly module TamB domain-containing protein, partial [Fimbriimonadaceae bacterium]|nr:translocation/assembly module TamB domain-containing protein [Fimbriimonadaceae bacterium]